MIVQTHRELAGGGWGWVLRRKHPERRLLERLGVTDTARQSSQSGQSDGSIISGVRRHKTVSDETSPEKQNPGALTIHLRQRLTSSKRRSALDPQRRLLGTGSGARGQPKQLRSECPSICLPQPAHRQTVVIRLC